MLDALRGVSGEEQQQMILEIGEGLGADVEVVDIDRVIGPELEPSEPAVRRDVLVLLAYGIAQLLDLDVAGLLGERADRALSMAVRVQRT